MAKTVKLRTKGINAWIMLYEVRKEVIQIFLRLILFHSNVSYRSNLCLLVFLNDVHTILVLVRLIESVNNLFAVDFVVKIGFGHGSFLIVIEIFMKSRSGTG
jgi:hypothetical protein